MIKKIAKLVLLWLIIPATVLAITTAGKTVVVCSLGQVERGDCLSFHIGDHKYCVPLEVIQEYERED